MGYLITASVYSSPVLDAMSDVSVLSQGSVTPRPSSSGSTANSATSDAAVADAEAGNGEMEDGGNLDVEEERYGGLYWILLNLQM